MQRAQAGNPDAFATLYARHAEAVRGTVRLWVRSAEDAEDVLQWVMLHAWRDLPSLREHSRFRYWLLAIARRSAFRFLRRRRKEEQLGEPKTFDEWDARQAGAACKERQVSEEVLAALAEVRPTLRRIAEQFYLEGLSVREIATRQGSPEGTVKRQLLEARQGLAHALGHAPARAGKETLMRPGNLDEALTQVMDALKKCGKAQFVPLLDREAVAAAIRTAGELYIQMSTKGKEYFQQTIQPLLRQITDENRWPEGVELDYFFEIKYAAVGEKIDGFSLGLEIQTPKAESPGFSLPIIDVWYGSWGLDRDHFEKPA